MLDYPQHGVNDQDLVSLMILSLIVILIKLDTAGNGGGREIQWLLGMIFEYKNPVRMHDIVLSIGAQPSASSQYYPWLQSIVIILYHCHINHMTHCIILL